MRIRFAHILPIVTLLMASSAGASTMPFTPSWDKGHTESFAYYPPQGSGDKGAGSHNYFIFSYYGPSDPSFGGWGGNHHFKTEDHGHNGFFFGFPIQAAFVLDFADFGDHKDKSGKFFDKYAFLAGFNCFPGKDPSISGVPLPGSLPLFFAGLAALAGAARMNRAKQRG